MRHAQRLVGIWAWEILLGFLPALYWAAHPGAPLWYDAMAAVVQAAVLGLVGLFGAAIALIGARHRTDGGLKVATIVAMIFTGTLWAALVYVRARYG